MIKEKALDITVNQPRAKDRGSVSNLSYSRRPPSDAYPRGECKFHFGSIGPYHLSIVQYLPKDAGSTPLTTRDCKRAYSSEFCVGASLLPDVNRSR